MPNGYDYDKEYGPHKYTRQHGTSDCVYGCGCVMGPARSSSKVPGVDPGGECPGNPLDGVSADKYARTPPDPPAEADFKVVITRRSRKLQLQAQDAEKRAKMAEERADKGTAVLQRERDAAVQTVNRIKGRLQAWGEAVESMKKLVNEHTNTGG